MKLNQIWKEYTMDKNREILRNIVKEVVRQLKERDLEEASTTGAVAGYNTPNAFSSKEDEEKKKDRLVGDDYEIAEGLKKEISDAIEYIQLAENRWIDLKKDDSRNSNRKIADQTSSIRKELLDIRKRLNWCSKIRNENDITKDQFFRRTEANLNKIGPIIDDIRRLAKEFKL